MAKYQFGSAVTVHLIETHLRCANPSIPGLPYDFFRDYLRKSGGSTRETEIAAEVFCGAFMASAVAFTDHVLILGSCDLDAPVDTPLGAQYNYTPYHPFGQRRRDAVETLALHAKQIYQDSGMQLRPSLDAIYALLMMEQMAFLTSEKGRTERTYVETACRHWRTLLTEKRTALTDDQLGLLKGAVGIELLSLDAQSAAVLRLPPILADTDLAAIVPHFSTTAAIQPRIIPQALLDEETGWIELGKQLAPTSLSITALYRAFNKLPIGSFGNPATLLPFYTALDSSYAFLAAAAHVIVTLPALPEALDHAYRAFDLFGLLNSYRRSLLRLDLLAHQRVIECFLASQSPIAGTGNCNPPSTVPQPPSPALLQAFTTSRRRVQQAFVLAVALARHATETSCLEFAKRLVDVLEVCTSWTSLRNAESRMAAELCRELGIGVDAGQILLQLLSLCSWSSGSAFQLYTGLSGGLTLLAGAPLPVPPYPPPPGVVMVDGKSVRTAPPTYSSSLSPKGETRKERRKAAVEAQIRAQEAAKNKPPPYKSLLRPLAMFKGKQKEEKEFKEDWSFLNAFASPDDKLPPAPLSASGYLSEKSRSSSIASKSTASTSGSSHGALFGKRPSTASGSSGSSGSSGARNKTISPVQAQLEAAAAPLRFPKPSAIFAKGQSISQALQASTPSAKRARLAQQKAATAAPPPPSAPPSRPSVPPAPPVYRQYPHSHSHLHPHSRTPSSYLQPFAPAPIPSHAALSHSHFQESHQPYPQPMQQVYQDYSESVYPLSGTTDSGYSYPVTLPRSSHGAYQAAPAVPTTLPPPIYTSTSAPQTYPLIIPPIQPHEQQLPPQQAAYTPQDALYTSYPSSSVDTAQGPYPEQHQAWDASTSYSAQETWDPSGSYHAQDSWDPSASYAAPRATPTTSSDLYAAGQYAYPATSSAHTTSFSDVSSVVYPTSTASTYETQDPQSLAWLANQRVDASTPTASSYAHTGVDYATQAMDVSTPTASSYVQASGEYLDHSRGGITPTHSYPGGYGPREDRVKTPTDSYAAPIVGYAGQPMELATPTSSYAPPPHPTGQYPSIPSAHAQPFPGSDPTAATLDLEPLDEQALALLANLPTGGTASPVMGLSGDAAMADHSFSAAPMHGSHAPAGQEWSYGAADGEGAGNAGIAHYSQQGQYEPAQGYEQYPSHTQEYYQQNSHPHQHQHQGGWM
ncbi:hypothetical protein JCM11641_002153 [Rhodosporidiobolus odoratus]